jgi:hypothetical protein
MDADEEGNVLETFSGSRKVDKSAFSFCSSLKNSSFSHTAEADLNDHVDQSSSLPKIGSSYN